MSNSRSLQGASGTAIQTGINLSDASGSTTTGHDRG